MNIRRKRLLLKVVCESKSIIGGTHRWGDQRFLCNKCSGRCASAVVSFQQLSICCCIRLTNLRAIRLTSISRLFRGN